MKFLSPLFVSGIWSLSLEQYRLSAIAECSNDEHYRYNDYHWKDCEWVFENDKCEDDYEGHHIGKNFCRDSCHYCDEDYDDDDDYSDSHSDDSCSDDERYRYYEDDYWTDCDWVYRNDRCDRVKNGKHVGEDICPYSCGYCDDKHEPSPTKKPTRKPTRKPSSYTHKPTKKPTKKPTSSCHSSLDLRRYCYDDEEHHPEKLVVHFENCHPEAKDWIGIYKTQHGDLGKTLAWWGNSYMWKFTCGSKKCDDAVESGTVKFRSWWDDLNDGDYTAYLFEDDGYHVKASSDEFEVGDCGYHKPSKKPTIKPTSYYKPTMKPTKKPTSYCHTKVEVEHYCYKDHKPTKLEVSFTNCHPEPKDWIGIYKVQHGKLGQTLEWWGDSYMWKFTCGSRNCEDAEKYGSLFFSTWWNNLEDGQYRAYLFENDGFHVKGSSETFKVGHCYY